ncbi:hypothetical protein FJZ26_02855 [Candidatus Parvarchaeota archaeon]|nr:hypothetical protein [Candidatus Parvarchaeota archaeon]
MNNIFKTTIAEKIATSNLGQKIAGTAPFQKLTTLGVVNKIRRRMVVAFTNIRINRAMKKYEMDDWQWSEAIERRAKEFEAKLINFKHKAGRMALHTKIAMFYEEAALLAYGQRGAQLMQKAYENYFDAKDNRGTIRCIKESHVRYRDNGLHDLMAENGKAAIRMIDKINETARSKMSRVFIKELAILKNMIYADINSHAVKLKKAA